MSTGVCRLLKRPLLGASCALVVSAGTTAAANCPSWDLAIGQVGIDFVVESMVVFDDGSGPALYAGGSIDAAGGAPANNIARWDGSTWTPVPGGVSGGPILAMAVYDGALYVGGRFTSADGQPADRIARWDGTSWSNLGTGMHVNFGFDQAEVRSMAVYDNGAGAALYIGGRFDFANGVAVDNIARYDGTTFSGIGGVSESNTPLVNALAVYDDGLGPALFVAGAIDTAGGSPAGLIARWDGWTWSTLGTGLALSTADGFFFRGFVTALGVHDGHLYAAGNFDRAGGNIVNRLARWDGTSWTGVGTGLDGLASAMLTFDDTTGPALFIGGYEVRGNEHIVKWDGEDFLALGGGINDDSFDVTSLIAHDDGSGMALIVGGYFEEVNTEAAFSISMWRGCGVFPDAELSEVVVDKSVISSFGGRAVITVTPRDANGNIISGTLDVTISASAGTLLGTVENLGDGTYRQEIEGVPGVGGAVISVIAEDVSLDTSPEVTFVEVDPSLSSITVNINSTLVGGIAMVTVIPRDDTNSPVGVGLDVQITTTLGELQNTAEHQGSGMYTQNVVATDAGTASITATVNGLPLDVSASLTVLSVTNIGLIVGVDDNGELVPYLSIQEAIDAADDDGLGTVFIAPGTYAETVLINGKSGLTIEALSGVEPVIVEGFIISDSDDVSLRYFTIDAENGANDAVTIRGRNRSNSSVQIFGSTIMNAKHQGIVIDNGNADVTIENCLIIGNGRNGIDLTRGVGAAWNAGPYFISNCEIRDNGHNGVSIGRDVTVTLSSNVIENNGAASGQSGGRYGISRERMPQGGNPQQVTLLSNTIADNNGRVRNNQSDENIENYDQIIDSTDDQPPYTD